MSITTITICGGGNAAHTLAGILGSQEACLLRVYAPFGDEAARWQAGIASNGGIAVQSPGRAWIGKPDIVSADPAATVAGASIILLALPAFAHEAVLRQIAPHISPGAWLGALPARGGFDLSAQAALGERLPDVILFGFQTLPWACRIQQFGSRAAILGTKEQVDLAAWPPRMAPVLADLLGELLGVAIQPIPNFLSLTLADTGQIIHPGIMYGLFHTWDGQPYPEPPLFYQGVDAPIAAVLQQMSDEIQALRAHMEAHYPDLDLAAVRPLKGWLERAYQHNIQDTSTLQSSFATNRSYAGLLAPVKPVEGGYIPDFQARYLSEDVPYNLIATRGIAGLAGVDTPTIDHVITWAQARLGKAYLVAGKLQGADLGETRSPQRYGITSLAQLVGRTLAGPPGEALAGAGAARAGKTA